MIVQTANQQEEEWIVAERDKKAKKAKRWNTSFSPSNDERSQDRRSLQREEGNSRRSGKRGIPKRATESNRKQK